MSKLKLKPILSRAEQPQPATEHQSPAPKASTRGGCSFNNWKPQDGARYGAAPLLPHESEERYCQIHKGLENSFDGYRARFEHHLRKELVDAIWKRQRWEHAAAGLTNRLMRQLTEAPPTDFETMLSELSVQQLLELPAPGQLLGQTLAGVDFPPALRATALVANGSTRAAFAERLEIEGKRFKQINDQLLLLRERGALLSAMDHYNGLAQVRVPPSIYDPGAEKITPIQRRNRRSSSVGRSESSMPIAMLDGLLRGWRSFQLSSFFSANRLGRLPTSTSISRSISESIGQAMH